MKKGNKNLSQNNNELDPKDLKIQALLERVSSLTSEKENQIADLRVELTFSEIRRQELEDLVSKKDNDVQEEADSNPKSS